MQELMRNSFIVEDFILEKLESAEDIIDFDCGDKDLNEYFHQDSEKYKRELMTQTYCFHLIGRPQSESVALVDFCNDALAKVNVPNRDLRKISHLKRGYKSYPAVKITRLGVDKEMHGNHIGKKLLQAIKCLFLSDNRCGCRFITVDAYVNAKGFYKDNGFVVAESDTPASRDTVAMFYDLKRFSDNKQPIATV